MLCAEALELAGALLARRRANGAEEARDEAEPLAPSASACRCRDAAGGALCLLAWTGATTYIALTAQTSPLIWFFPAVGLVMLAFFIATGGAPAGRGRKDIRAMGLAEEGSPTGTRRTAEAHARCAP